MPKSAKPAPPQQASLKELWGKKRDKSTAAAPPKKEEEAMDVDVKQEVQGNCLSTRIWPCLTQQVAGPSKRKEVETKGESLMRWRVASRLTPEQVLQNPRNGES